MEDNKNKFNYGDLVIYSHIIDFFTGRFISSYGRIYGKIDKMSAMWNYSINSKDGDELYVFVPRIPDERQEIVDAIEAISCMSNDNFEKLNFVYGNIPKDKKWLVVNSSDLTHALNDSDKKEFKKVGLCPDCGSAGYWLHLHLFCEFHGKFS